MPEVGQATPQGGPVREITMTQYALSATLPMRLSGAWRRVFWGAFRCAFHRRSPPRFRDLPATVSVIFETRFS